MGERRAPILGERITVSQRRGGTPASAINVRLGRLNTREAIIAKYRECAGHHLSDTQVDLLQEQVMNLEKLGPISQLTATLGEEEKRSRR